MWTAMLLSTLSMAHAPSAPTAAQARSGGASGAERTLRPRWRVDKRAPVAIGAWQDPTRLVLKIEDDSGSRVRENRLVSGVAGRDVSAVRAVLEGVATRVEPYVDVDASELARMRETGQEATGEELADLSQYFLVTLPAWADAQALIAALHARPEVEEAYCMPRHVRVAGDLVPPMTPDLSSQQYYLNQYRWSWLQGLPGTDVTGVTITDVEASWNLSGMFGDTQTHEDLQALDVQVPAVAAWNPSTWVNPLPDTHHGTAVLGILAADDDAPGMRGLVPRATIRVSGACTTSGWKIAQGIAKAASAMAPGDVILIELQINGPNNPDPGGGPCVPDNQFGYVPIEYLSAEFNAIKSATANGIGVIEPAGNGTQDFDDWTDGTPCVATGHSSYALFDPNVRMSGAVLVGAAATLGGRASFSNHGRRVDTHAEGEQLRTLAYGDHWDGGSDQEYTAVFGGTSGASPQIAAQAALATTAQRWFHGLSALPPYALRMLLRTAGDPTDPADGIGLIPNLETVYRVLRTGPHPAIVADELRWTGAGALNARAGSSIVAIGDADGDGWNDLAVSSPWFAWDTSGAGRIGRVRIVSGITGEAWATFDLDGSTYGGRLAAAGDVNGNGYPDVIIGDPAYDQDGHVWVYDGWTRSLLMSFDGTVPEQHGWAVAGLGDLDGDGKDDFAYSAVNYGSETGRVFVKSGADGSDLFGPLDGDGTYLRFGQSLDDAGDVDGDGIHDLVVGATFGNAAGKGRVAVYSGADASLLRSWTMSSGGFGYCVAGVGDVNRDGYDDIAVGMPFYSAISTNAGRVVVLSGSDGTTLHTLDGAEANTRFGVSIDGLGDVDGNQRDDFVVGAPYESFANDSTGAAYVIDGRTGTVLQAYHGEEDQGIQDWGYGECVASAGDLDGDGVADVVVGAPYYGSGLSGRIYAYLSPARTSAPAGRRAGGRRTP